MKIALIDHYDSFTYNVIDWLVGGEHAVEVIYVPFDDAAGMASLAESPLPLVISPGPKAPAEAPSTMGLVRALLGKVPILGICFGHQILAAVCGAKIIRGVQPIHGTVRKITLHAFGGLFTGFPDTFHAATYNSLVAEAASLALPWQILATCEKGEVQAMSREVQDEAPAFGIQFHPESFLSEQASRLRANWLEIVKNYRTVGQCSSHTVGRFSV